MRWCIALLLLWNVAAQAEETQSPRHLIAVMSDHCPFCEAWEEDIGRDWDSLNISRVRQLHIALLDETLPEPFSHLPAASVTPTFILVDGDTEVARFVGYQDQDIWWMQMDGWY